jgi:hypothetical protein
VTFVLGFCNTTGSLLLLLAKWTRDGVVYTVAIRLYPCVQVSIRRGHFFVWKGDGTNPSQARNGRPGRAANPLPAPSARSGRHNAEARISWPAWARCIGLPCPSLSPSVYDMPSAAHCDFSLGIPRCAAVL